MKKIIKKKYSSPKLDRFGSVKELTRGGTASMMENSGNPDRMP